MSNAPRSDSARPDAAGRKTLWALCDQGIISAGNFCTNLILIRHLAPATFGVFALLLNAMLFLNNVHAATVTYTVCIRGAQAGERSLGKVATGGVIATLGMAVLNIFILFAASSYVGHRSLILFVIAASVSWQVQEALRTVFVSRMRYDRALIGDGISYLGQAALIALVCFYGTPSLPRIFIVIAATSLFGAALQAIQIRPSAVSQDWLKSLRNDIWNLGKWSFLAKLVAFFSMQAFPWVLAYRSGLASVAAFQSLFQLVALTNPILLSSNNLIMASIAKSNHEGESSLEHARKYIWYSAGAVGLYFAILLLSGGRVMSLFYGRQSVYLENASLLGIFVAAYALEFVSMFAGAILAGKEKTRPLFLQQLAGMLIAVCFVLPLVAMRGLRAAVFGLVLVNAAKALAGWYMVLAKPRKGKRSTANVAFASR